MSSSQKPRTTLHDPAELFFASDSVCYDILASHESSLTIGCSDQPTLDTQIYATNHRSYRADDDQMHDWTGLIDGTNVSPHPFGNEAVDWNLTTGITSDVTTTHIHTINEQPTYHLPSRQILGIDPDNIQRSMFENAKDNTTTDMNRSLQTSIRSDSEEQSHQVATSAQDMATRPTLIRCWLHGCKGRSFTHLSNYRRHCRENLRQEARFSCLICGKRFTRKAAWKIHTDQQQCRFIDYDANGVPFERKRLSSTAMDTMGISQTPQQ
jgi:hypothetical protein